MEVTENKIEYKISRHAQERYSERIMDKEDTMEINRFITLNEDKIKTDINLFMQITPYIVDIFKTYLLGIKYNV